MPVTDLLFKQMSTPYFLYYSWIELKVIYGLSNNANYKPISLTWFLKASRSLRDKNYFYFRNKLINFKKLNITDIVDLRNRVIECAIFNVIYPYFCFCFLRSKIAILEGMCIKLIS